MRLARSAFAVLAVCFGPAVDSAAAREANPFEDGAAVSVGLGSWAAAGRGVGDEPAAYRPIAYDRGFLPPPAPSAEQTPMPPTASSPAASPSPGPADAAAPAGSKLYEVAPWNPTPPAGMTITPPESEYPTVKVTGFFQADAVWFDQDDANKAQVGDVPDGADFRRARLGVFGEVFEGVSYRFEVDFALPGRPNFMDVYLDVEEPRGLPAIVRIGQWRQPFGMASATSDREFPFLERPLPFALVPFRQIGIGLRDPVADNATTWAASMFRYPTDVFGGNVGDSGGYSLATRETVVFGGEDDAPLLHLGGGYGYLNSSFDTFRYLNQPEVFVSESPGPIVPADALLNVPAFVDTGLISAEQANLFGAELAGRVGSLWSQAEVYSLLLDRLGGPNPAFWGAYLELGYILTGEVRPYSKASGVFTRVVPDHPLTKRGGIGAWEVAARWSALDLNDAEVGGGRLTDFTAGLNWYLNPRTKIQFNYIHASLDRPPVGGSFANILAARAQLDF